MSLDLIRSKLACQLLTAAHTSLTHILSHEQNEELRTELKQASHQVSDAAALVCKPK